MTSAHFTYELHHDGEKYVFDNAYMFYESRHGYNKAAIPDKKVKNTIMTWIKKAADKETNKEYKEILDVIYKGSRDLKTKEELKKS
ncbi:MAG: hypothetical protein ABIH00_02090 [Armatimonadota bacterium]